MSSIPRTTITVLMLSTGLVMADWRLNGKVVPDTPWARSAGDFGVQLVLTDKPDELFAAWEKPGRMILYSATTTAKRGIPIMAVVFFVGCLPDAKGECDATVRYQAYTPDGKSWGDPVDAELWIGKKAPGKDQMQLSVGNMGIVVDPGDPLGLYTVKATVVDKHAKKTLVAERTFTAVEADAK